MSHLPQIIYIFSPVPSGNEIHGVIQSLAWLAALFVITFEHEFHSNLTDWRSQRYYQAPTRLVKRGDHGEKPQLCHDSVCTRQEATHSPIP